MNVLKSSRRALYHLYATLFLKESFLTGSSAARLMLLSRMKKRMRLVKMLWLTTLWQRTLNLQNKVQKRKKEKCFHLVSLKEKDAKTNTAEADWNIGRRKWSWRGRLLVGVAEDKESSGLRHGDSLLLQLNVREGPWPRAHRHLWLIIVFISWLGGTGKRRVR